MNKARPTADQLKDEVVERAYTIPSSWYTDIDFHDIDRRYVLARNWHYAGPLDHVSRAGDYFTAVVAGNPVIVVRDGDDLRGFYNVCKHRGGPLATDDCGRVRMLQCKYHGWTYQLNGVLRGVPRFDRTDLFEKKDFGLDKLDVAVWENLVFVKLSDAAPKFPDLLDGITERIAPASLGAMKYHSRVRYSVACNWKVYVDNYLEGYHLPLVHPELCDTLDYGAYRTELFDFYSLQHSNYRDSETARAYYYFIYPNTMLNILPDRLQVNSVVPKTSRTTEVIFDYFYPSEVIASKPDHINDDQDFADRIQQEDIEICEHVQIGLESDTYDQGRFSAETEHGVHHFQQLLRQSYRNFVAENE